MKISVYNRVAVAAGLPPAYRGTVITVHGMMTTGAWQKRLGTCLQDALIRHHAVDYGFVTVGALWPPTVNMIAKKILDGYEEQLPHCGSGKPSVIAHSLGTLGLGRALDRYEEISLSRVILHGSILSRRYPWGDLARDGRVEAVMNDMSNNDFWVYVAPAAMRQCGAEASGRYGFHGAGNVVANRQHKNAGHSGLQYPLHYREIWVPFLLAGWPSNS